MEGSETPSSAVSRGCLCIGAHRRQPGHRRLIAWPLRTGIPRPPPGSSAPRGPVAQRGWVLGGGSILPRCPDLGYRGSKPCWHMGDECAPSQLDEGFIPVPPAAAQPCQPIEPKLVLQGFAWDDEGAAGQTASCCLHSRVPIATPCTHHPACCFPWATPISHGTPLTHPTDPAAPAPSPPPRSLPDPALIPAGVFSLALAGARHGRDSPQQLPKPPSPPPPAG